MQSKENGVITTAVFMRAYCVLYDNYDHLMIVHSVSLVKYT